MKSTVETLSPTRVRLAVEVPFEDLRPSLDSAYRSIAQQLTVPGFRKGRVPARVIDQRIGRGAVLQEAVSEALPRLYGEAAREHEIQPLGEPEITDISPPDEMVDGAEWHFTAEVDVRPEITLPDLTGLAVTVDDAAVTDADVDEQLGELRQRFGTLVGIDRPAADGDYISVDLVATVDGEQVEGASATGLSYVVGSDDVVGGLDDAVRGLSAGDSASFDTTLRQGEHAGKAAEIAATVNTVKVQELPELDDDFAQMASEFDTIDELRADTRVRLGRVRLLEQGAQARDTILEQLIGSVEFPVPESVVEGEVESRRHEVVHMLNHDDGLFDRYLEAQGTSREEFDAELRDSAEKSVRAQFILDEAAERMDVQIGDGELTEYLVRQAARYQMAPQEFANQVMQSGNLPQLVADIRRNKALSELLEHATITDRSGDVVDLAALSEQDVEALADDAAAEVASDAPAGSGDAPGE